MCQLVYPGRGMDPRKRAGAAPAPPDPLTTYIAALASAGDRAVCDLAASAAGAITWRRY